MYVILFGKKDLETLKNKISIKKYIAEIEQSLVEMTNDKAVTAIKVALIVVSVAFVILNALAFLQILAAVVVGTFGAKKSYEIPAVSNYMNKLATYINRLK